jgi:hypothetical protein
MALVLATGVWRDGARVREVRLRAPDPERERALVEEGDSLLPAERVTLLLGACVQVGGVEGAEVARELSAGDRVALLLEFHRALVGKALPCVLDCPAPGCDERLELDLRLGDLIVGGDTGGPLHEVEAGGERVVFSLPTGADEERAARRALTDSAAAARELLAACLVRAPEPWPAGLADTVGAAMAAVDPQAELTLEFTCPACERRGAVTFDPAAYVWAELVARARRLEREVHVLASRYGWSEREIVALAPHRRARYLELVELEPVGR